MSRAQDLFKRLERDGMTALNTLIADREPESLFLDFKLSKDEGSPTLRDDDNKNLSKAISGFANSSGGVVVWGVDCRRDTTGIEIPVEQPLKDAAGFATKLQSAVSRTTVPPHPGVLVTSIAMNDGAAAGFVAVLIPQSLIGPLRSTATKHYHLRTGSSFEIVPHDVLAGMFGRPPRPKVDVNFVSYLARHDANL